MGQNQKITGHIWISKEHIRASLVSEGISFFLDKRHDVPDFKLIKPTHLGFTNCQQKDNNTWGSSGATCTATLARKRSAGTKIG
jgi:hypothetical protein